MSTDSPSQQADRQQRINAEVKEWFSCDENVSAAISMNADWSLDLARLLRRLSTKKDDPTYPLSAAEGGIIMALEKLIIRIAEETTV